MIKDKWVLGCVFVWIVTFLVWTECNGETKPVVEKEQKKVEVSKEVEIQEVEVIEVKPDINDLFAAMKIVESGYGTGYHSVGDDGKAIGPYQIWKPYWIDSRVKGKYEDCRDKEYAEKVVMAYWKRYAPQALMELDFEKLARCHNSGPGWKKKYKKTNKYWKKVQSQLG
jgi:hypothetical protein